MLFREILGRKFLMHEISKREFDKYFEKLGGYYTDDDVGIGFCLGEVDQSGNIRYYKLVAEIKDNVHNV